MKSIILKSLLTIGCAAGIAALSSQALACGSCHRSCHTPCHKTCSVGCTTKVYAFHCDRYVKYHGHQPYFSQTGYYQGRPVKYVHGSYYFVQKCTGGYWKHHHHRACCS